MKILIYTGYSEEPISVDSWQAAGADGMAYTWQKLAACLAANGHNVTVSGKVKSSATGNLKSVPIDKLASKQHFDVVIGVAYIHFIPELDSREISWDKAIFWVHYTTFYPWYKGSELEDGGKPLFHDERLHHVVAASPVHAKMFAHRSPSASALMHVIPHALDPDDWTANPTAKVPGRFIYSSAASKGLDVLLQMWPQVRELISDASLLIASPDYSKDDLQSLNVDQPGVVVKGLLNGADLYNEINQAQYFLYPCPAPETFSLTALEMMMGGVSIVSTDAGNLGNLLEGRAKLVSSQTSTEQTKDDLLQCLRELHENPQQRDELKKVAQQYAKQQTWNKRYQDWMELFKATTQPRRKHLPLYSYYENKEAWKDRFLTYAARTREWELVVDEPFDSCYSFPLFTPEFCRMIREEADYANCWTTDRHSAYPTTDILLEAIGLKDVYLEILNDYVVPMARESWVLGPGWKNFSEETFLAKYTPETQGHLALHHDESDITCLVQLSDVDEYTGGGTFFSKQKVLVRNPIGYATVHPGNISHRHGGRAISGGVRFIVVSFIKRVKKS